MADTLLLCPTCGQRIPAKESRICGVCLRPILLHHKYYFDGSTVKHKCCENPTGYAPSKEKP